MSKPIYTSCPKCGHQRSPHEQGPTDRCPACGLYFDKWLKRRFRRPLKSVLRRRAQPNDEPREALLARLTPLLLPPIDTANPLTLFARTALWLALLVWGIWFMLLDHRELVNGLPPINYSIMHNIDLIFHEAGHAIFRILGNFLGVLGGSLMQLLVPGVAMYALLIRQRDPFGASVAMWWLAQSTQDLAPCIYDARRQGMQLLGGGTGRDRPGAHDWNNLLGRMGLLEADHSLAWMVNALGVLMMAAALLWGGLLLRNELRVWRQPVR